MIVIGFGYKAYSGKDTAAKHLIMSYGFQQKAFATSLKKATYDIFKLDHGQMYGNEKEDIDPFWGMSPRTIMQKIGDGLRNSICEDVWIRALERDVFTCGYKKVVITDIRYPNELEAIQRWGGYAIKLKRTTSVTTCGNTQHASEVSLDSTPDGEWDYVLDNNGTVKELYNKLDYVLPYILKGKMTNV